PSTSSRRPKAPTVRPANPRHARQRNDGPRATFGFQMTRIWLCADDYGISPSVNAAIRDLVVRGRINAASVMVVAPSSHRSEAHALNVLNAGSRRVAIGLHLTLTAPYRPLSKGFAPLRDGAFVSLETLLVRAILRGLNKDALAAEITCQIRAFVEHFG